MQMTHTIARRSRLLDRAPHSPSALRHVLAALVLSTLAPVFLTETSAQTPVPTDTATPTPTDTATPTPTPDPGATPAPTHTASPTPTFTATPTPAPPTPTEAPTSTPTVIAFNPAATPAPGGDVVVISKRDVHTTQAGERVGAGSFQINNTSDMPLIIRLIRIEASEPIVFASLTLASSAGSDTVSIPTTDNTFSFEPGIQALPGDALVFTLGANVGEGSSSETPTPGAVITATPTSTPTSTPRASFAGMFGSESGGSSGSRGSGRLGRILDLIGVGVVITGLLTALLGIGERRWRRLAGMALVLFGIALYAGCGTEQTSRQTVAEVTAENPLGPASLTGLPADIGSVSRPQPLIFPGSSSGTPGTAGLTTLQ